MTDSLAAAIERVRAMPVERQDELARLLIHEIEEDQRWTDTTQRHEAKLGGLVEGVLKDDARGECEPLDPESL